MLVFYYMSNNLIKSEKTKKNITTLLIIASYLPFLIFSNAEITDASSVLFFAARQAGYLATIMLLWQFILGTRAITRYFFKDHIWVLDTHKQFGIYGILLILAHPILITIDYGESANFLLYGPLETDFDQHVAMGRFAFFIFMIIWISSAILRKKIGYRPWRYIHYLAYLMIPFLLLHVPETGTFYAFEQGIRTYWAIIAAAFGVIVLLRALDFFTFGHKTYKLISKKEISKGVYQYVFEPLTNKRIIPNAGQFLYVRKGFWSEEHPFSIVGHNEKNDQIFVAAKVFGKYTAKLSNLELGTQVYLDGPYGVFTAEANIDETTPTTFIAGGIGITPFIPHVLNKRMNVHLFSACRTARHSLFDKELKAHLGDKYIQVHSEKASGGAHSGYIDAELLKSQLGDQFAKQTFYICGPAPMMAKVKTSLQDAGIDQGKIHTEEFGY